ATAWPPSSRPAGCNQGRRAGGLAHPPAVPARRSRPMLVRHATPARNVNSILRGGLLTSKSQGKLPVVRLCRPARSTSAILQSIKRHGGRVVPFALHVRNDNRERTPPLIRLKAVCGPGDDGEPVLTVMRPDED